MATYVYSYLRMYIGTNICAIHRMRDWASVHQTINFDVWSLRSKLWLSAVWCISFHIILANSKGLLCIGFNQISYAAERQFSVIKTHNLWKTSQSTNDFQTWILSCTDINALLLHGKPTVWNMIGVSWMKLSPCFWWSNINH